MAVHRLVDGDAVDPERHVGRVVGAEAADRRIGGEPWSLTLVVHLDSGGLAQQLIRVQRRGAPEDRGRETDRAGGLVAASRRGGDGNLVERHRLRPARSRGVRGRRPLCRDERGHRREGEAEEAN